MDASFKQYDYVTGMDLQNEVPFDAQGLVDSINASATVNDKSAGPADLHSFSCPKGESQGCDE